MTKRRRIWPVSKWVGKGYPQVAPFVAVPACLDGLCQDRGLRYQHRYVLERLIELARQAKTDRVFISAREFAAQHGGKRRTVADIFTRLGESGLVGYLASDGGKSEIDLEPCRVAISAWHYSLESGAKPATPLAETVPSGSQPATPGGKGATTWRERGQRVAGKGPLPGGLGSTPGSPKSGRVEEWKNAREAAAGGGPPPRALPDGYKPPKFMPSTREQ